MEIPKPIDTKIIASPKNFNPLSKETKVVGAFNPGVTTIKTKNGLETILLVRVAEIHRKKSKEHVFLPYFKMQNTKNHPIKIYFDKETAKNILDETKKSVFLKNKMHRRLKHISLPRAVILDENGEIKKINQEPALLPEWEYTRFGKEDLRITKMNDNRYIITAVSAHREFGVSTSILITKDFEFLESPIKKNTNRPVIIGIKDVAVLPEKIPSPSETETIKKGELIYAALRRPNSYSYISTPGIWLSYSQDLVHWGQHHRLTKEQNGKITGTGTPLIHLDDMWVGAFHEIDTTNKRKKFKPYSTKLIGLDFENPWKVKNITDTLLKRDDYIDILPKPGYVPNVVYATGITENNGITNIFSGIDDKHTVKDKFYTEDLIKFLKQS
ncbi:hypothetical protein KAT80_03760 [Candidatus Pacearchaeota archaeon]|nr:hypothetical protein [Candidatus Pacearchaeota archaeon]